MRHGCLNHFFVKSERSGAVRGPTRGRPARRGTRFGCKMYKSYEFLVVNYENIKMPLGK